MALLTGKFPIQFCIDLPPSHKARLCNLSITESRSGNFYVLQRRRFFGVQVNEDESVPVYMGVDLEQAILGLVEAFNAVKLWCLYQFAFGIIAPAMISASQDKR